MNYLAHLFLADDDPDSVVGSLMGDFAKGRVDDRLAPAVRQGILMHRKIDTFTDAHPVVRSSKRRLGDGFRRYGGVLVDLFYDHFLALRWPGYSAVPLEDFASDVYRILEDRRAGFPAAMQRSVSYMTDNDLLLSYRTTDGIRQALRGIEGRLKRPSRLSEAVADLELNYGSLEADFSIFFPDLIDYVGESTPRRHETGPGLAPGAKQVTGRG